MPQMQKDLNNAYTKAVLGQVPVILVAHKKV